MVIQKNGNKGLYFFAGICILMVTSCTSPYKKGEGGYEYKILSNNNTAKKITYGNFIEFHFKQNYKSDGVDTLLRDTREYMPGFQKIDSSTFPPAYLKIFEKAAKGDSIVMKISIDSAYNQPDLKIERFMRKGGFIYTTLKIINVFEKRYQADSVRRAEFKINQFKIYQKNLDKVEKEIEKNKEQIEIDSKSISTYLDKNDPKYIKGKWGTFIVVRDTGTGEKINYRNVVAVNYTGKTFEKGIVFNSNIDPKYEGHAAGPYEVTMSKPGDVIPGWADALMQLNNGAKATLYIPSSLAYGKKGFLPLIKPNENIVFEIEVVRMITEIRAMEIVSENIQRAEEAEQKKITKPQNK